MSTFATVGIGTDPACCSPLPGLSLSAASSSGSHPAEFDEAEAEAEDEDARAPVGRTKDHTIAQKTMAQTASAIQYH